MKPPSAYLGRHVLVAQDVGRLGEHVVAQVHDHELGRQRLAGVPGRALRLAAAALGTGGEVEEALPGEVLDLAAAEYGVLGGILEVDRLALGLHRQQRAQAVGQPLERDVERRQADVQVLGVQHDEQEHQHHADVQQQRDRLDPLVGGVAQRVQDGAHELREECAVAVGQVLGVHRGAADQRVRPDDVEDHEEDQPGATGVRSIKAGFAAVLLGLGAQPDDRERDDAEQHGDGEEVLHEAQAVPAADERNVEIGIEQQAVRLEVDGGQDEETPHGEEVRQAGDGPLEQSCLPEHLFDLGGDAGAEVILAPALVADGLTRPDQRRQPQHAPGRKHQDHPGHRLGQPPA